MIHDLLLQPIRPQGFPALSIQWDEHAGAIAGRDAERALEFVHSAKQSGFVVIHPWPTSYRLSANPLTSRADMAAIFGQWYILPAFLADAMPVGPGDDDVDPDGVEVTYSPAPPRPGAVAADVAPCFNLPSQDDDPLVAAGREELYRPLKWR